MENEQTEMEAEATDVTPEQIDYLTTIVRKRCPDHRELFIQSMGCFRIRVTYDGGSMMMSVSDDDPPGRWALYVVKALQS